MARTPKNTVNVRRLPKEGETIMIPVRVTRIGRNTFDTADTLTISIPGASTPVTINAEHVLGKVDD